MKRAAVVSGNSMTEETIGSYLPGNYEVIGTLLNGEILIEGEDSCGWTLDDYVIPRLQSGLYGCREIPAIESLPTVELVAVDA